MMLFTPLAVALAAAATPQDDAWTPHRALKVLYAGAPGGSREAAFGVIDLAQLSKERAAGFDVVIADWKSQYGKDGYEKPDGLYSAPATLDDEFVKPVVAVTYVGTQIRRKGKLDWY